MIHKKQLSQFAKNIVRSQKGLQNHQLMHPGREWTIGLCVALGIFVASAIWSALAYVEYRSGNLVVDDISPEQPVVYREAQVTAALDTYVQRARALEALVGNPLGINEINPSASSSLPATDISSSTASSTQDVEVSTSTPEVLPDTENEVIEGDSESSNQTEPNSQTADEEPQSGGVQLNPTN